MTALCSIASATVVLTSSLASASGAQDEATLRKRSDQVRATLQDLRSTADNMEGRLIERVPGSYVFIPLRLGLPEAPVANPEKVSALAVGLPLRLAGHVDEQGRLTIDRYTLVKPGVARGGPAEPRPPAEVERAASAILEVIDAAIKPGVRAADRTLRGNSEPARVTRQSRAIMVAHYRKALANGDITAAEAIVRQWAETRLYVAEVFTDETEYKALYGPSDNYPPWRYGVIHEQSQSVVAIGESGQTMARCSGVLIAPDLVLTAGHCFSEPTPKAPAELEVWFDYAEQAKGVQLEAKRRPISGAVVPLPARWAELLDKKFGPELLDFAIVRFKALGDEPLVPNAAKPQCLYSIPLARGEPIYVVGYPRGERLTVHDSARVYLPYRELAGDRFYQLRLDVEADFLGKPIRDEVMEQFDKSYEAQTDDGIPWRYFRSVLDSFQPRMGIVADTFRGNSGGPVFDHERDQCVAGILISGASDTGVRRSPTWREHERVLPATAILDALKREPSLKSVLESLVQK